VFAIDLRGESSLFGVGHVLIGARVFGSCFVFWLSGLAFCFSFQLKATMKLQFKPLFRAPEARFFSNSSLFIF